MTLWGLLDQNVCPVVFLWLENGFCSQSNPLSDGIIYKINIYIYISSVASYDSWGNGIYVSIYVHCFVELEEWCMPNHFLNLFIKYTHTHNHMHTLDICLCDNVKINLISFSISHQQLKTGVWLIAIPYICDNLCWSNTIVLKYLPEYMRLENTLVTILFVSCYEALSYYPTEGH